jgi:glycosyltransferase involved in cell wall biosynthesis
MHVLHFLLPGRLDTATGGTGYDRRIIEGLGSLGWQVIVRELHGSFPHPDEDALADADAALTAIPDRALTVIDGLALGAMPEVVARHGRRLRLVALLHHPLALETGLPEARAQALRRSERQALAAVRRVIVTSPATARHLAEAGLIGAMPAAVVVPGTDPAALAAGSGGGPTQLLCVATVTPRKDHASLIEALAALQWAPWRLTCVGSLTRCPVTADALRARISDLGVTERVDLCGEVHAEVLAGHYHSADIFVLPSRFEGFGMAYAEALARGLPVLGTTAGAIPDTVPADAGLLVEPGSPRALTRALERLLTDAALRERLAAGARRARERLIQWPQSARRFAQVLRDV